MRKQETANRGCLWIFIAVIALFIAAIASQNVKADAYDEPVIPNIHRTHEPFIPRYHHNGYWQTLEFKSCNYGVKDYSDKMPCNPEPKKVPEPSKLLLLGVGIVVLSLRKIKC